MAKFCLVSASSDIFYAYIFKLTTFSSVIYILKKVKLGYSVLNIDFRMNKPTCGYCLLLLLCPMIFAVPNAPESRRFAVKPNDIKKQEILYGAASSGGPSAPGFSTNSIDRVDDKVTDNAVEEAPTSFWGNLFAIAMQVLTTFFNDGANGVDKIDNVSYKMYLIKS